MLRTGENEQGLKKIIDMTRMGAIVVLLIHFYYHCYGAFHQWHFTAPLSDRILQNIVRTGLLSSFHKSKLIAISLLLLSVLGVPGRKNEKLSTTSGLTYLGTGILLYFGSGLLLLFDAYNIALLASLYMAFTTIGFILVLTGGGLLSRVIRQQLRSDVFNKSNETFPQEERLIKTASSLNFKAQYSHQGKIRTSYINLNAARGVLVAGNPGSGKSFYVVEPALRQFIEKQHALFLYDVKFPELSTIAYNHYLRFRHTYSVPPAFYLINFDNLSQTSRCNPLDPANMEDITDAAEAARAIMYGLNRSWLKRQGEFFVESPINFVTAIIWFLRRYQDGQYCTLPHVIELMNVELDQLLTILQTEPEINSYISPFISAYRTNSMEQLEGQVDSAKIGIARLSSPALYYVLSRDEVTLDINNPTAPKIICIANNLRKQEIYSPILSLYLTRMAKIINQSGQHKCAVVVDEFPTLTWLNFETLVATGRSRGIHTLIAIQSEHQLRLNYGREWADAVTNICGNIILGQLSGDLAKSASERIGKTLQDRENLSINSSDTSISRSKQLELAVPVSTIANLSAGEFVGLVADSPEYPISLKAFHAQIINEEDTINSQKKTFLPLPYVRNISQKDIQSNYQMIKQEVQDIVDMLMEQVLNNDSLKGLLVKKD